MSRQAAVMLPAEMSDGERGQLRGLRKRKHDLLGEIEQIKNELKEVDNELESMYYIDESGKSKQKIVSNGRKKFNKDPQAGIQYLTERSLVTDPESVARWIFETEGLSKSAIGDYLGLHDEFPVQVLQEYVNCFDFVDMFLVDAIRLFLKSFRLPGESQKIDRIMDRFSRRYVELNPYSFESADACHSIAFSCIMLNTLLYNPNVKDRITLDGYIDMCKDYLDKKMVTVSVLTSIYESIKVAEFAMPTDDVGAAEIHLNADREGWLYKQSSGNFMAGPLSWKKRWFVLSEQCLYYFEQTTDREPRGIIPLQNVGIRRVEGGNRPHMFEIFSLSDDRIKACKTEQDGRMVEGRHSVYRVCAANQEDLRDLNIHDSRWLAPWQPLHTKAQADQAGGAELQREEQGREDDDEFEEFDPFAGLTVDKSITCSNCNYKLDADNRSLLTQHYQSDWHKFNVRQTFKGKKLVTEEEFEDIKEEDDDTEEPSDDVDDDAFQLNSTSRVYFVQNDDVFSIHRAILHADDDVINPSVFRRPLNCAIFLMAGGHFAGAVFKNDTMIVQKTIHRYVVRAKQGGAQSANDNAKGAANSAGAALRRYNERTLHSEINQLLKQWKSHLDETPLVFIRCATYNKQIFHQEEGFARDDVRLRTIPFETRRPAVDELKRTWLRLAMVSEHGFRADFLKEQQLLRERNKQKLNLQKKQKQEKLHLSDEEDEEIVKAKAENRVKKVDHIKQVAPVEKEADKWPTITSELRQELYNAIRADDVNKVDQLIRQMDNVQQEILLDYLNNRRFSPNESTILHFAASLGLQKAVTFLLGFGCDPGVKNNEGFVPYIVSLNKNIKKLFVDFRESNPNKWEWTRCHIPEPVKKTAEELAVQEERKREKKNRQKEKLKQKKKAEAEEAKEKAAREAYAALPEREKRALAAEARLAALSVSPRCVFCAAPLPAVPFEYQDVKLCSPSCVAAHRAKFQ